MQDVERERRDLAQKLRMRSEELRQALATGAEWQKQALALTKHVQQLQAGDAFVLSEWESYSHTLSVGLEKVKAQYDEALG